MRPAAFESESWAEKLQLELSQEARVDLVVGLVTRGWARKKAETVKMGKYNPFVQWCESDFIGFLHIPSQPDCI